MIRDMSIPSGHTYTILPSFGRKWIPSPGLWLCRRITTPLPPSSSPQQAPSASPGASCLHKCHYQHASRIWNALTQDPVHKKSRSGLRVADIRGRFACLLPPSSHDTLRRAKPPERDRESRGLAHVALLHAAKDAPILSTAPEHEPGVFVIAFLLQRSSSVCIVSSVVSTSGR